MKSPRQRKIEYREGEEARENFDAVMRALFRAPKTVSMSQTKKKPKSRTSRDHASNAFPKED